MPFLFSIPSALLTLDIILEEADSALMDDGSVFMPPLCVAHPPAHLDLRRDGLPLSLKCFPGHKAHGFCWVPYGLYDCMTGMWAQGIILDLAGVTDMCPRVVSWFQRYVVPL